VSLTDTCWEILTAIANEQGNNRSDVIEALVRSAGSGIRPRKPDTEG
jgi:metal-responsive CopG/Arc/MetJ family transcriptional regulator